MNEITAGIDIKSECIKYLDAIGLAKSLTAQQKDQFIEIASAYGLNPFKREIYAIKYGDKFNLIVGYEVYLKRAERSGLLDGWEKTVTGEGKDLAATVIIYRKDWTHPLRHTAYLAEFNGSSPIWQKMPRFMLEKVATAQAFRLAFPDELGGIPYTEHERDMIDSPAVPQTEDFSILAARVRGLLDVATLNPDKRANFAEIYDAAAEQGDTVAMLDLEKKLTAHPQPKPIEEMTPDEIDDAIEKGLAAVYVFEPAREKALAKYPDKAILLAHLREKYAKQAKKAGEA
ncbi:MAG TPA: phage recombination protein Bet [Candidatus Syntrophosphaera sp.]|nr:phage recombination protein Bet [Candidatus Syntrophosphaera sp.]